MISEENKWHNFLYIYIYILYIFFAIFKSHKSLERCIQAVGEEKSFETDVVLINL